MHVIRFVEPGNHWQAFFKITKWVKNPQDVIKIRTLMTFSADSLNIILVHVVTIANQGCHIPFWDRVQGGRALLNWENYDILWNWEKNCTPFKWGNEFTFSFRFSEILTIQCSLSLKILDFWVALENWSWPNFVTTLLTKYEVFSL